MTDDRNKRLDDFLSLCDADAISVQRHLPLKQFCTFRIGGEADYLLTPKSEDAFCSLLRFLLQEDIRFFLLGKGSNILFDDNGYRGVIVSTKALNGIRVEGNRLIAQAGASVGSLSAAAERASLTGMEFLYGIPGSIGGAVYMNAGAYDGEISHILSGVRCFDCETREKRMLRAADCDFSYRHSRFMSKRLLVLEAEFTLEPGDNEQISARMAELMHLRAEKQPLNYPSAGSAFKRYPGRFTAKMIDEAGMKGVQIGGAQISEKHAGFIINRGDAKSADVRALIALVTDRVQSVHGVKIEPEIEYLPE